MTITTICDWFILHAGGAIIIIGSAVIGVAAGAVAFKWVKGMLFG